MRIDMIRRRLAGVGYPARVRNDMIRRRLDRAGSARTSLLSADGLAGLRMAGFDLAGEVFGAAVLQIGSSIGSVAQTTRNIRRGGQATWPAGPGLAWDGYDRALGRMREEATALNADGVVGIRLADEMLGPEARQFVALGTAVRSRGAERPPIPFTTDLSGPGLARMLGAGWVPARLVVGFDFALRYDEWGTEPGNRYRRAPVAEVTPYTKLVGEVRAGARRNFAAKAEPTGADGVLMSDLRTRVWRPGESNNIAAECLVIGNAVARFGSGRSSVMQQTLSILPLTEAGAGVPGWRRRGMTEG